MDSITMLSQADFEGNQTERGNLIRFWTDQKDGRDKALMPKKQADSSETLMTEPEPQ